MNKVTLQPKNYYRVVGECSCSVLMTEKLMKKAVKIQNKYKRELDALLLDNKDELIAELRIPEVEIRDVAIGQHVVIDTRNSTVEGRVSRIDPAVNEGTVLIDVEFTEPLPADARPDLTVDGRIEVANIQDTLFVARPLFAQSQSVSSVYQLTADGNYAERVRVRLGSGSINIIEVVEGLNAGDRIIVSDTSKWSAHDRIRID